MSAWWWGHQQRQNPIDYCCLSLPNPYPKNHLFLLNVIFNKARKMLGIGCIHVSIPSIPQEWFLSSPGRFKKGPDSIMYFLSPSDHSIHQEKSFLPKGLLQSQYPFGYYWPPSAYHSKSQCAIFVAGCRCAINSSEQRIELVMTTSPPSEQLSHQI